MTTYEEDRKCDVTTLLEAFYVKAIYKLVRKRGERKKDGPQSEAHKISKIEKEIQI